LASFCEFRVLAILALRHARLLYDNHERSNTRLSSQTECHARQGRFFFCDDVVTARGQSGPVADCARRSLGSATFSQGHRGSGSRAGSTQDLWGSSFSSDSYVDTGLGYRVHRNDQIPHCNSLSSKKEAEAEGWQNRL